MQNTRPFQLPHFLPLERTFFLLLGREKVPFPHPWRWYKGTEKWYKTKNCIEKWYPVVLGSGHAPSLWSGPKSGQKVSRWDHLMSQVTMNWFFEEYLSIKKQILIFSFWLFLLYSTGVVTLHDNILNALENTLQ